MQANTDVIDAFRRRYGREPAVRARAPGRVEILGNHTDYNEGFVMSAAIDRAVEAAAAPADDGRFHLASEQFGAAQAFAPDRIARTPDEAWADYIKGMLLQFEARGVRVPPFVSTCVSDLPVAAGLSSSAAMEMSHALAALELAGATLPMLEIARAGQAAENEFVGVKCGILDQISSLFGRENHGVLIDCRTLDVENVSLASGAGIVVVNSGVKHTLVESEYNVRRAQCEEAVAFFRGRHPEVRSLRDVRPEWLDGDIDGLDPVALRRARHVVLENRRVLEGARAAREGNLRRVGELMFASHESSRDLFENSCPELDLLVELARGTDGVYGAKLSGGGFGGCTVTLVEPDAAAWVAERLAGEYTHVTHVEPERIVCRIAGGAEASTL